MPTISIILPTYNRVALLPRAVQSILLQTFNDFELIIVDDGSTDGTKEYLKTLDDGRVRVITKENGGQATALNTGLDAVRGEYVTFCDDDDEYLPHRLETCMHFFTKHTAIDACYSAFYVQEATGKRFLHTYSAEDRDTFFERLFIKSFLASIAVMIKRSAIEDLRFDETLSIGNDYDFFLRLAGRGVAFDVITTPTVVYYKHAAAMTRDYQKMATVISLLKRNFARFKPVLTPQWRKAIWSSIVFREGKYHYWLNDITKARSLFWNAIKTDWGNKRAYAFLPFTFFPRFFDIAIWIYQKVTGRYYSRDCA